MTAAWLLATVLACGGCGEKNTARDVDLPEPREAEKRKAKENQEKGGGMQVVRADEQKASGPAPSRAVWGLELGGSTEAQVAEWVEGKGLNCARSEDSAKGQVSWTCREGLTGEVLGGRTVSGAIDQLVLIAAQGGALGQVAVLQKYDQAQGAVTDYAAARTAVEATLGPPAAAKELSGVDELGGSMARFNTSWSFTDLQVTVTAAKGVSGAVTLTERWLTP